MAFWYFSEGLLIGAVDATWVSKLNIQIVKSHWRIVTLLWGTRAPHNL